ncbi:hypothetical protein AAULR_11660, partial [Lacticaseibacillus rhamnosus MTCC 5462]
ASVADFCAGERVIVRSRLIFTMVLPAQVTAPINDARAAGAVEQFLIKCRPALEPVTR